MTFLLDTCILSKLRKLRTHPDSKLSEWISRHSEATFFISVLTIGEIQAGIAKLNPQVPEEQQHRMTLEDWLYGELVPRFQNRILNLDVATTFIWGKLSGEGKRNGTPVPVVDGLIAATAIQHSLIVVTDNVKHLVPLGVEIVNPWASLEDKRGSDDMIPP